MDRDTEIIGALAAIASDTELSTILGNPKITTAQEATVELAAMRFSWREPVVKIEPVPAPVTEKPKPAPAPRPHRTWSEVKAETEGELQIRHGLAIASNSDTLKGWKR